MHAAAAPEGGPSSDGRLRRRPLRGFAVSAVLPPASLVGSGTSIGDDAIQSALANATSTLIAQYGNVSISYNAVNR